MLFTIFKKAKLTEVEIRAVRDCAKICGENVFKSTLSRKALAMQLEAPSTSTQFDIWWSRSPCHWWQWWWWMWIIMTKMITNEENNNDDDDNVSIQVDCLAKHLLCDASISNPFDIWWRFWQWWSWWPTILGQVGLHLQRHHQCQWWDSWHFQNGHKGGLQKLLSGFCHFPKKT